MTTGTVMRKMMSSTSMTSTSGVVLMSDIGTSSPPSPSWPTFMDIFYLPILYPDGPPGGTDAPSRRRASDLLRARIGRAGRAAGRRGAARRDRTGRAGRGRTGLHRRTDRAARHHVAVQVVGEPGQLLDDRLVAAHQP